MAAAVFFTAGPPELVLAIVQHASSAQDVVNLWLTCKHVAEVLREGEAGTRAACRLILNELPAADYALIAVRATRRLHECERLGKLPPHIDLRELSAQAVHPTGQDIIEVRDLHHFVLGLEGTLRGLDTFDGDLKLPSDVDERQETPGAEHISRLPEWRSGFHRSAYLCIIAGAALARVYVEPVLALGRDALTDEVVLTPNERQALSTTALFRRDASLDELDAAFGPFAEWLLESMLSDEPARSAMAERFEKGCGRALCCRDVRLSTGREEWHELLDFEVQYDTDSSCKVHLRNVDSSTHADGHYVVWETMKMLWQQNHMLSSLYKNTYPYDRGIDSSTRKCVTTVLGLFTCFEVTTLTPPARFAPRMALEFCEPADTEPAASLDALECIWRQGRPSYAAMDCSYRNPVCVEFFSYFLKKNLALDFWDEFLDAEYVRHGREDGTNWECFVEYLTLFALDDVPSRNPSRGRNSAIDAEFLDGTEFLDPVGVDET